MKTGLKCIEMTVDFQTKIEQRDMDTIQNSDVVLHSNHVSIFEVEEEEDYNYTRQVDACKGFLGITLGKMYIIFILGIFYGITIKWCNSLGQ